MDICNYYLCMKSLQESLLDSKTQMTIESLFDTDLVSKDILYHPKTKGELRDIIKEQLKLQGPNANLNIIDVSKITDMEDLFFGLGLYPHNIDISKWDVSNVENMNSMFYAREKFNSDLSKWNVNKVKDMRAMFYGCENFNSDLSKWDVKKVKDMGHMFEECKSFNSDLSKWDVENILYMDYMFHGCKSLKKIPSWYEKS